MHWLHTNYYGGCAGQALEMPSFLNDFATDNGCDSLRKNNRIQHMSTLFIVTSSFLLGYYKGLMA